MAVELLGPMVLWMDPVVWLVLCRHRTSRHPTVLKTNTGEVAETTTVRAGWRVSHKTRGVQSLVVTRTADEAKSQDESDQRIDLTVGLMREVVAVDLRSVWKASVVPSVNVEVVRNVAATGKVVDETAKERGSRGPGGSHVKAAGVSAAPVTTGDLREGMSAREGAGELVEGMGETMAVREDAIPRTKRTVMRRGDDRISCWQLDC